MVRKIISLLMVAVQQSLGKLLFGLRSIGVIPIGNIIFEISIPSMFIWCRMTPLCNFVPYSVENHFMDQCWIVIRIAVCHISTLYSAFWSLLIAINLRFFCGNKLCKKYLFGSICVHGLTMVVSTLQIIFWHTLSLGTCQLLILHLNIFPLINRSGVHQ